MNLTPSDHAIQLHERLSEFMDVALIRQLVVHPGTGEPSTSIKRN
jgi:hypothetical protein